MRLPIADPGPHADVRVPHLDAAAHAHAGPDADVHLSEADADTDADLYVHAAADADEPGPVEFGPHRPGPSSEHVHAGRPRAGGDGANPARHG